MNATNANVNLVLEIMPELLQIMIDSYANAYADSDQDYAKEQVKQYADSLKVTVGDAYIKIDSMYGVRAFVVINASDAKFAPGDLLKAKSGKAPERNFRRGNIFKLSNPEIRERINWHGVA